MSYIINTNYNILNVKNFNKIHNNIKKNDILSIDLLLNQHHLIIKKFLKKFKIECNLSIFFKNKNILINSQKNITRIIILLFYLQNNDFLKLYNLLINKFKKQDKKFNKKLGIFYHKFNLNMDEIIYNKLLYFIINNKDDLLIKTFKLTKSFLKQIIIYIKKIENKWF